MPELALRSLDIAEYRGLGGMKLEDFGRINLLVGGNNSGKTSVLEALALFARPLDIDNWINTAWRREIKSSRVPVADTLKWMFPRPGSQQVDSGRVWISGTGAFNGRRALAEYSIEKVVTGAPQDRGYPTEVTGPIRRIMELRLLSDYVGQLPNGEWRDYEKNTSVQITRSDKLTYGGTAKGPLLPLAVIDASSHRVESTVQDLYSLALENEESNQDFQSDFIRILQQIDPGVQRLDLVRAGRVANRLQVKHEKTGATPLSVLGDGFRRALMIAVTIPTARGGLLLIDELETALHVSVLDSVLGMLRWATEEFNVQVFATTHSLEAVDAVVRAFKEDPASVVGYRLERPEGRPLAKRMSGEGLRELRFEMGLEFR